MAVGIIVLLLFIALAFLPSLWVKSVLARHSQDRSDYPGTGGEFARHVLDRLGLETVAVEETTLGDHYDPEAKIVRLSKAHYNGRSLAAVAVAAHEVGHAMQDATGYAPLVQRTRMAKTAIQIEKLGSIVMLAAPIVMILAKSPHILLLQIFLGVMIMASTIILHALTLPVEFDASFKRALPLLREGNFIDDHDLVSARQILRAAALTYVAAAAISLLDVMRWLRVLRV